LGTLKPNIRKLKVKLSHLLLRRIASGSKEGGLRLGNFGGNDKKFALLIKICYNNSYNLKGG